MPYPADYGGAIEQFYKIKWLHRLGIKIHLHCYTKARPQQDILLQYCSTVHYYPRQTGFKGFSFRLPYIVSSRSDQTLLKNLEADDHPVLMEGVHCTYLLHCDQLQQRDVFIRLHNVEYRYYQQLAAHENNHFNKFYYGWESFLLKRYEKKLARKYRLLALSKTDQLTFSGTLEGKSVHFIPAFVGWEEVMTQTGKGCYCLYHGNLSINENEEAAVWLLQEVFDKLSIPFVIAGKDPSQRLEHIVHQHEHTCLVKNPGEKEMQDIIGKAQVHILPSFNNTGVKLKLMNALYNGRHCVVNPAGVQGSGLESLCHIAADAAAFRETVQRLYNVPVNEEILQQRRAVLLSVNNNQLNAEKLVQMIWPA